MNCQSQLWCVDGEEGNIRLRAGRTDLEGRVEICIRNVWGTVCNDSWNENNTRVVCSQLGFSPEGILYQLDP